MKLAIDLTIGFMLLALNLLLSGVSFATPMTEKSMTQLLMGSYECTEKPGRTVHTPNKANLTLVSMENHSPANIAMAHLTVELLSKDYKPRYSGIANIAAMQEDNTYNRIIYSLYTPNTNDPFLYSVFTVVAVLPAKTNPVSLTLYADKIYSCEPKKANK